MALRKNYFGDCKQDSPILYVITAEMVQSLAEANLGRMLTEKEIERLHYSMIECDDAQWSLMEFMIKSAEDAMDEEKNNWSGVDEDYEKRKHSYYLGGYSIGEDQKPKTAVEKFQEDIQKICSEYYSKCISENVKRGIQAKKNKDINN